LSVFSHVAYLAEPDPVLPLVSNEEILLIAGNLELILAALIITRPESWFAKFSLLSFCITLWFYRLGMSLLVVRQPCPCLGRASDWLHLTPAQLDKVALSTLIVLTSIAALSILVNPKPRNDRAMRVKSAVGDLGTGGSGKVLSIMLALFVINVTRVVAGSGIELSGVYEYTLHPDAPAPLFVATYNFKATISGCKWAIECEDIAAITNSSILNGECVASCDGNNIYYVQFQNEDAVKKSFGTNYESLKNRLPAAIAEIYPGDYPMLRTYFAVENIWFAFASKCVIDQSHGTIKPPYVVDLAVFENTNFYSNCYFVTNGFGGMADEIVIRNNGNYFFRDTQNGRLLTGKLGPPFSKGYTNAIGLYENWTNVFGENVPMTFEFSSFSPSAAGRSTNGLLRITSYKCIVTNVAVASIAEFPIAPPTGNVMVTDHRFAASGSASINYFVTNEWLQSDNYQLAELVKHGPMRSAEQEALMDLGVSPHHDEMKYIVWALMSLPLCVLLIVSLARKAVKHKHQTPEQI
jgi:hypothetical protein